MRKIYLFHVFLVTIVLFSSCGMMLKKVSGLKNPRVETEESVLAYLQEQGYNPEYCFVQTAEKDSATIIDNMIKGFGTNFMIFDSEGQLYHYKGEKGYCSFYEFNDALYNMEETFEPCHNDTITLQEQLSKLKRIDLNQDTELPPSDYYMIFYWSKFGAKKKEHREGFTKIQELAQNDDPKVTFLLVNADLQKDWGLKEDGKIKLKIKVTGKSGSLSISEIPFEN